MKLKKNYNLSLDKFIDLSLYNKKFGYYMKRNPFGIKGDYITAPNISRLFSEIIAIWIISFWQSLGSPKKFNLIELGSGNGEMMKILIESFQNFPVFLKSVHWVKPVSCPAGPPGTDGRTDKKSFENHYLIFLYFSCLPPPLDPL